MHTAPRCGARVSLALLGSILWANPVQSELLINEILYDPPGPDGASEFVELYNSGPETEDLAGVELLFVNGSAPDLPRTVWVGRASRTVAPGDWFVIGEADVVEADAHAALDLQNGSEALWLRRGAAILDRVAWGEDLGLGRGAPASDPSGRSLGRVPDGADSGDNATDFRELSQPNAGRANARASRLELVEWAMSPPWMARAGRAHVRLDFEATGYASVQEARLTPPPETVGEATATRIRIALGDTAAIDFDVDLTASSRTLTWALDTDSLRLPVQVGFAQIRWNEVQARPASGEAEWIELYCAGPDSVDLEGWSFADATGQRRDIGPLVVRPGEYFLLSADPAGVHPTRPAQIHRPTGGWAALNQSDSSHDGESYADELTLLDPRGAVVDWVRWSASDFSESGRSLERGRAGDAGAELWVPAPRGASPGAANDAARYEVAEHGLRIDPNPFTPDQDGDDDYLVVSLRDRSLAPSAEAEILDLSGDLVTALRPARASEVVQWIWDGRDGRGRVVEGGAYVLLVRAGAGGNLRRLVAVGAAP